MKKINKKSLALLICAALLLTFTVSGTVAYLVAGTNEVTNTFTPTHVTVDITDNVSNGVKSNVTITNTSNIDAYIRAAIVGYWCNDDDEIVAAWNPTDTTQGVFVDLPGENWAEYGGYYYYTVPIEPGEETGTKLFTTYTVGTPPVEGAHLVMNILVQAVQADGVTADGKKVVVATWDVDPSTLN